MREKGESVSERQEQGLSLEENDLLRRSKKKFKRSFAETSRILSEDDSSSKQSDMDVDPNGIRGDRLPKALKQVSYSQAAGMGVGVLIPYLKVNPMMMGSPMTTSRWTAITTNDSSRGVSNATK
ncbi:hypothetical protein BVRB_006680 [Beta vulgaris subsp. vulgaris]|uniref:Uncharacterized protein n=1 Tax=Beta vulgaris subsp. vulgaris TaxID=3555 RepID=A0A0J8B6Q1_BETVV|nr:hypothetical protein BVRB_006680 [Beta vulgaris subsp. vulgaris]